MTPLPAKYEWLAKEKAPKIIVQFVNIYGVREIPGKLDSHEILGWAKEVGLEKIYVNDEIAWCGLEMAVLAQRAGKPVVENPLWARNWLNFGQPVQSPGLGDCLVFSRQNAGHVGVYIAEDRECFHVGGGNESNMSNIVRIPKIRLLGARRPIWAIAQPKEVRKIFISASGEISLNES